MRGSILLLILISFVQSEVWEDDVSEISSQSKDDTEEVTTEELIPRKDFVRITRASGERHERQISRRLEAFGDGERHMITVDRNGNILQFRRPSPSLFSPLQSLQSSPFRQSPSFLPRGFTRPRSSNGFSRRRPTPFPITTRIPTTITHDGSIATLPTVTREGTVTNEFRRIPVRTQPVQTGGIHSMRLVHGGSMERGRSREGSNERSMEILPISHPIGRGPRPLRISSSFEVETRGNDRFRIGGPPFGEVTTIVPSTRVLIENRPFHPRPPPPRQRPQQPPRRVEALSNDEQEFITTGRSPISPSVVAPFRAFRPHLPSTRFTIPPRSPVRFDPSPIHSSPLPSSPLSSTDSSTTTQTTTPSTTTVTESTTTLTTTPSTTTIETTTPSTLGTTATTARSTISSVTSTTRRTTQSLSSSKLLNRGIIPVSPLFHSSSFNRPHLSTLPPSTTFEPLLLTPPPSSSSPFLHTSTNERDLSPSSQSSSIESIEDIDSFPSIESTFTPFTSPSPSPLPSSTPSSSQSPSSTPSSSPSSPSSIPSSTPDPSIQLRDSPPFNQNVRIITTSRTSLSSPQFDLSDLPDEFNFDSSSPEEEPPTTPRPKLASPQTEKNTVLKSTSIIGKTTTVPKMTTVISVVSRVTPPPTTKTRKTGTTRGFATVSPSISVKSLPPVIPDDLSLNEIRGPLPPVPLPHSTTVVPSTERSPSHSLDGPPGEMPPSDNVVQMLNEADDFLDMARRLNITRKARLARRRRRMAEFGRSR